MHAVIELDEAGPRGREPADTSRLVDRAWREHYPYLVNVAFRLLGDIGDAEDAAQEAFVRLSTQRPGDIADARGWLAVVTSRICLDRLRSAYARRERATEPATIALVGRGSDPGERVVEEADLAVALRAIMHRLSPAERVAFVLHDVFRTPFEDIAVALHRPVAGCRQLAARARRKLADATAPARPVAPEAERRVIDAFRTASHHGDLAALVAVLQPDAWGRADVLTEPPLATPVVHGNTRVARNLNHYLPRGVIMVDRPVADPATTLLLFDRRQLFGVITLTVEDALISGVHITVDPSRWSTADHQRRTR